MSRKLPVIAEISLSQVYSAEIEVASNFEALVRNTAHDEGLTVSCRSGCSNCCYHPVHLTVVEGMLLYKNLVSRGRWTPSLKATFEEHASKVRDASYEVWLLSMIPCPLLDEGTKKCTVYNARPFQCRVTYSTGDPYNCHPHRILESEIVNKRDVTEEFHSRVNRAIRKHGITTIIMPLSVAVLVGEKISNGEYDLDGADMAIFKDYVENT